MTAFAFERRDVKTGHHKICRSKREAARLKRVAAEKVVREEKKLAASAAPPVRYVRGIEGRAAEAKGPARPDPRGLE